MIGFYGIVGKWSACTLSYIGFQPIIEAVDVGEADVFESKDASEEFKKIAEEVVLSSGGIGASFFFRALSAPVEEWGV